MSKTKNKNDYKILAKLNIIIYIQFLFFVTKCQDGCSLCEVDKENGKCKPKSVGDSTDEVYCNNNCKYHLGDGLCHTCSQCSNPNHENSNYFYNGIINFVISCSNKEVKETKECVSKCVGESYELGDFCYLNCSNYNASSIDSPIKQCVCNNNYTITTSPKIEYHCLGDNEACSDGFYYDSDKKECIIDCGSKLKREDLKRCSSECHQGEFKYTNENGESFCYGECPPQAQYYYYSVSGVSICTQKCKDEEFYNGIECVSKCPSGSKYLIDLSNGLFKKNCSDETDTTTSSDYPYIYEGNYYFKNCEDVKVFFNKPELYSYDIEGVHKCVESCLENNTYIDETTKSCVECKNDNKCFYGQKCIDFNKNDENFNYFIIEEEDENKPKRCTDKCPQDYYTDRENKTCYNTTCRNRFIDPNKECVKECRNPIDETSIQPGEGYIYILKPEESSETVNDIEKKFCYPSCFIAGKQYYRLNKIYDNNTCFDEPCSSQFLYSTLDNPYICYKKCEDINNGEYKFQSNYICYKEPLICEEPYYYFEDGTKKCSSYNECKEKGFKYILEKECIKNCNQSIYYSYYDGENLGECFLDSNNCIKKGYPFFNNTSKICSKTCENNYKTSRTDPIKNKNNETCFELPEDCPDNYPKFDRTNKMCYQECPLDFYHYRNECLVNCTIIGKYHFNESLECVDNCFKNEKNNYETLNNDNKICYEKCPPEYPYIKKRVFEDTGSYICIDMCDTPYYYEDTKQCATSCGNDLFKSSNKSEKICVKSCQSGQKIYNGICVDDCSEIEGFPLTALMPFSNTNSTFVDKCVSTCPPSYPLILESTKRCVSDCPVSESFKYNGHCYPQCPNNYYYDPLNNNCSESKCPPGLKYYQNNSEYFDCKMSCPRDKFHPENGGECLDQCEVGQKIGGNNFCLSQCNETTGEYYIKIDEEYNISQCVQTCGDTNYTVYDTKECVPNCPPGYYKSENNKICYEICNIDPDNPFSTKDDEGNLICSKKCHEEEPNYGSDQICRVGCSGLSQNITDYDNACVSKCENPLYRYLQNWTCVKECSTNYTIEKEKDSQCVDECLSPYNYIVGNECRQKCDDNHFIQEETEDGKTVYKCLEKCDEGKFYYETGPKKKNCLTECKENFNVKDYIIENTNICISSCNSSYFFYHPKGENFTYKDNTCVKSCPDDMPYYDTYKNCLQSCRKYVMLNQFNCLDDSINNCPRGTREVDNYICGSECPDYKFNNNDRCEDSCPSGKYYIPGINNCLDDCDRELYRKEGDKCVMSCNETYFYINSSNTCDEICPNNSYYIEYYTFDNGFTFNSCFEDCPDGYPFYSDNDTIQTGITLHICKTNCQFAIKNPENNKTFECLDNMNYCPNDKQYYDPETKLCDTACPSKKEYYITMNKDDATKTYFECYNQCPNNYYQNQTDTGIECVENCGDNFLDYETKMCAKNCSEKKEFEDDDDAHIKYCLDNCTVLGLFTNGGECVKKCDSDKHLIENMATKNCDCENLFYMDGDEKKCLDSNIKKCSELSEPSKQYRVYKDYECKDNCGEGILSVNEDYCYPVGSRCPNNSKENSTDFPKKCVCSYKYYKDSNNNNQIVCLGENIECPASYPLLMKTNECVKECGGDNNIEYDNKCLKSEDFLDFDSTTTTPPTCTKENIFFKNGTYICTDETINCSDGQYLTEKINTCVDECNNPEYFIYDTLFGKKKCVSSCNNTYSLIDSYRNEDGTFSYKCKCKYKWYKNGEEIICALNNDITCEELSNSNFRYLNRSSNECINTECKDNNLYNFNNECFKSCEDAKNLYGMNIVVDGNSEDYKCKCGNLWRTINNKIECIEDPLCIKENYKYLRISSKECVDECKDDFNYEFNHICYNNVSCPEMTFPNNNKCECDHYYYKYNDSIYNEYFIKCLPSNECPSDYPYLKGKECLQDKSNCSLEFNYECYEQCPNNTIINGNKCECDKENPWLTYIKDNKEYLNCSAINCPFIDNSTNECLITCKEDQYIYNGRCFANCPENTRTADKISKECVDIISFVDNLIDFNATIRENIQDLYEKAVGGGIIYNIDNTTLQIYRVNKNRNEKIDLIMRSNLTYIDLSQCIDKISGVDEGEDILIVKYDIGDITDSSTINPVEFMALNQNGQVLDLSPCENSIVISYPISSILNSYISEENQLRNLDENINNLNLREKFLKGKELYLEDNEIDSFNFQNKLYTDLCCPCEINGKDLILEDRYKYLYPLSSSFCESNCFYQRTDFVLERVFCTCSPKGSVNFDREFSLQIINANDKKAKDNQKGSLLKCFYKVSNISKNFGFFYGFIILLVEIGMLILTILYSYKVFKMRIKKKFDVSGGEINFDTENVEDIKLNRENKKTDENLKTSQRHLAPPKKTNKQTTIASTKTNTRKGRKEETRKPGKKDVNDPEVININKLKIKEKNYDENEEKMSSFYEKSSVHTMKDMEDETLFELIKNEEKLLTVDYNYALKKNKAEIIIIVLTEILDKIYLIKAIWLLQKYEIFSLYFSLYLLWHMLIVSFLSLFYTNDTLHKIWTEDGYPDMNYYLGFGFVACLISFIFYKGLSFLINNDRKIKEIETINKENKREIGEKFNKMMYWAKIKMIIFYIAEFILVIIFFFYLIAFCGVNTGTNSKLVEGYGIALIEVIIIKVLYGLILGILRKIALSFEINLLYNIVKFLDLYIS